MTRILMVDDHAVLRRGLQAILEESIPDATFGEAASGEEALREVRAGDWDLVTLDLSLPGKSGLEVLKELRQERPELPVLMLSMHPEEHFAVRALSVGAAGYVTKETAVADLVAAVKRVLAGGKYVSPSLAEGLAGWIGSPPGVAPHELLSDRELQVFRLLARGKAVTDIAAELGLAVPTVSTHRARILGKMGMTENADLVQYAIVNRLFE